MNHSLSFSLGASIDFFSFDDVFGSLDYVISSGSEKAFLKVSFSSSNDLLSGFFKICHKFTCMGDLRIFRRNFVTHSRKQEVEA